MGTSCGETVQRTCQSPGERLSGTRRGRGVAFRDRCWSASLQLGDELVFAVFPRQLGAMGGEDVLVLEDVPDRVWRAFQEDREGLARAHRIHLERWARPDGLRESEKD